MAISINLVWCCYNGLATVISFFIFSDKKSVRGSIRIPADIIISKIATEKEREKNLCDECGYISNISDMGANIVLSKVTTKLEMNIGDNIFVKISEIGTVGCTVLRKIISENKIEYGVFFTDIDYETVNNINQFRFSNRLKYIQGQKVSKKHNSMIDILTNIFKKDKSN